ncbi:MAG: hypothetical protein ACXAAH_17115 [Promethearchaeota archaeon]|jgi:hypothetical protein
MTKNNITIEEKILLHKFPEDDFDWGNYYDWVEENPLEAYSILIDIVKENNESTKEFKILDKYGLVFSIHEGKRTNYEKTKNLVNRLNKDTGDESGPYKIIEV